MANLIYIANVSLDSYIEDEHGSFNWTEPNDEVFAFVTDLVRSVGTYLYGRRLYEEMIYWETAAEQPSLPEHALEFARIWKATPKVVFSRTLDKVEGNATLVKDNAAEVVAKLKEEPGKDLAVGGAGLAASLMPHGLIDEYRLFVSPVVLGAGTAYFPALNQRIELELVEARRFGSRVVYLRYQRA